MLIIPPMVARLLVESSAQKVAVGLQILVELILNHPRFNAYPSLFRIDLDDAVHIARHINDDARFRAGHLFRCRRRAVNTRALKRSCVASRAISATSAVERGKTTASGRSW